MTNEQISKAATEYAKNSVDIFNYETIEMAICAAITDFTEGAVFANKYWKEKIRWIPIEERTPPIGKMVITKQKDFEKEAEFLMTYAGDQSELTFVTHWKEIN